MSTDAMFMTTTKAMIHQSDDEHIANNKRDASEIEKMTNHRKETPLSSDIPPEEDHNLEQIKGIGEAISSLLQAAGINSYAKLAQSTPDQLVEILKPDIPAISARRIIKNNWIGQAREIISAQGHPDKPVPMAKPEKIESETPQKEPLEGWDELADFFVSFGYAVDPEGKKQLQTKIHHSQNDLLAKWDGIAIEPLVDWMVAQGHLPMPPEADSVLESKNHSQSPQSTEMEPAEMETYIQITNLQVSKILEMASADKDESEAKLKSEGQWVLEGPDAFDLTYDQIPYRVETYLTNTQNNQSKLVAATDDYLIPGEIVYDVEETFDIPPLGRYQLYMVARLLPPKNLIAHQQGPVIRIEAQ